MKNLILLLLFITSFSSYSQTEITDSNFQDAVDICLSTNPVDGMCSDSEYGAMPYWDVSQVTDMAYAFAQKLNFNADISNWNVSNVTNMSGVFYLMEYFNQDIGDWDVSSVTNMHRMFLGTYNFNQDIGDWDVSSVTNMSLTFSGANSFNGDISDWDVSSVGNMGGMFTDASSFNGDISDWNVSSVNDMWSMFSGANSFNGDISDWDVSSVGDINSMFANASSFNGDISDWDVYSVTNMSYMFDNSGLSTDNYDALLNGWSQQNVQSNVSLGVQGINYCNGADARQSLIDNHNWAITDAGLDCSITDANFTQAIETCLYTNPINGMCSDSEYGAMPTWDVSNVTNMSETFKNITTFNGDLSSWNVSSVTDMLNMFYGAESFNGDISAWDVSSVTNMYGMFYEASSFNQDISGWCVTNIASEPSDFSTGSPLSESNKPVWGSCSTAGVDDLTQLDISIYPNPTSDIVYIDGDYTQLKVVIYNILGKEVINKSITNSIDISHLENGVYLMKLSDGFKLYTRKVIKN